MNKEELGDGDGEMSRAIPIKDLNGWAAEQKMVRDDYSGGHELIKRIDGEVDSSEGVLARRVSPLKEMISSQ